MKYVELKRSKSRKGKSAWNMIQGGDDMSDKIASRVWNKNFFLLWQGGLVSFIGDMLYQFALGFWVLDKTGSTAVMGLVVAAGFIPQIFFGFIAGTYVDRHDRKKIIVLADMIRGAAVIIGGGMAFLNLLPVWGVVVLSVVIGGCSSFFYPAVGSVIPDIVPVGSLEKANSLTSMIQGGGQILGKTIAGFLYAVTGAPVLFIVNGLSYLLSGISESFIAIPQVHMKNPDNHFFEDFRSGALFLWKHKALRSLIAVAAFQNFNFTIAEVLFLPYFREQIWLGPARFGIFEAVSACGALLSMTLLSIFTIPQKKRATLFITAFIIQPLMMAAVPHFRSFFPMLIFIFFSLFINAIVNVMLRSLLQKSVPSNKRGKVLGFVSAFLMSFIPLGLAAGGILGDLFPIPFVISGSLILGSLIGLVLIPDRDVRLFLITC